MNRKRVGLLLSLVAMLFITSLSAQPKPVYDTTANAKQQVAKAVENAAKNGKHVLLQIGGNWCPWCIKLHRFYAAEATVKAELENNYELVMVNYSKENKNLDLLKELDYPQRFGFPVLVVLDGNGKRIHTQNSAYLEKDGGYSVETVTTFLKQWSPGALNPELYTK